MKKAEILELNEQTMLKYPTYEAWARVHLRVKDKNGNLKEAFAEAHKKAEKSE
jgi:hypothetical protein